MSKDKISDYSSTANSNTDIASINIDENCAPSGINNAIRALMAQLKNWQSGAQDVYITPAGSVSAPAVTTNGDTNTGVYFPAADKIALATGGTQAVIVDSSQNVGIGTSSPFSASGYGAVTINGTTGGISSYYTSNAETGRVQSYSDGANAGVIQFEAMGSASTMKFRTNSAERMRIDSSGNVGIGTSSPSTYNPNTSYNKVTSIVQSDQALTFGSYYQGGVGQYGLIRSSNAANTGITDMKYEAYQHLFFTASGASGTERMRIDSSGNLLVGTTTSPTNAIQTASSRGATVNRYEYGPSINGNGVFYVLGTSGGVYLTSTGTAWTSNSDERLKTALTPFKNAVEKVCSLRAGTGRYLADDESISRSFLIAQDVQAVLPEAVFVQNDEQQTLGLAYTDTIPLLVAAIQEQQAIITQLQADVAALKGN